MREKRDSFFIVMNILSAIFAAGINYFVNFYITPYITENVGVDAYGFLTLAITLTSYIDIIAVALNAFASRYISIAYHAKKYSEANTYFNSAVISNFIFSIIIIIPATFFIINIQKFLNVPSRLLTDVKILFFIILLNYAISIIGLGYAASTFIANRLDKSETAKAISYLIKAIIVFMLCSYFLPHIWYVGVAYIAANLVILISNMFYTKVYTPQLHLSLNKFSMAAVLELLSAGIWNSLNALGNVLNDGLDLLITNAMLSSKSMGQVSIGKNLSTLYNVLLNAVCNAFKPRQLKFYAEKNTYGLVRELKMSMNCCGFITSLVFAGFVSCGKMFLHCWIPTQNIDVIYLITCICMAGNIIVGTITPLYYVYTLTKKLKFPSMITIFMGILNVVGMYILLKKTSMGIYAVVLTTAVLNTVVHIVDAPIYSARCLKIKWWTFYPEILKHLFSCGITTLVLCLLVSLLPHASTWKMLALIAIPCVVVGCIVAAVTSFGINDIKVILRYINKR